jgi:pimeloyl-ACP methyl ester carboxylesterase
LFTALVVATVFTGCGDDHIMAPDLPSEFGERIARDVVAVAGWPLDPEEMTLDDLEERSSSSILGFVREQITDDIFHYSFDVPVGPGPFDVIGIHRVVREDRPFRPTRTTDAIFLAHGDVADFASNFLAIAGTPADRALSILLARADIDVWGLDFGWSRVPEGTTDFSFMAGWGIGKDADHLGAAISVARFVRQFTGSGRKKMHLFGYSGGGQTSYAYLSEETLLPPGQRHVKGFIPFDSDPIATDSPEHRERTCVLAAQYQDLLDAGVYQDEFGLVFATAGFLAQVAPHDPSPIIEGFDNLQAALFLGAATWNLLDYTPYFHFVGGEFEDGLPTALRFSMLDTYLEFTKALNPYFPTEIFRDRYATQCGHTDVPWDDHLSEIAVPILVIGGGGAIGEYSVYSAHATGSSDITTLIVDLDADRSLDFGHIDLLTATDAPSLVWMPIRDWILSH